MAKFSDVIIVAALDFIRRIQEEMGELGQEKVFAMMDAFDPDLRDEVIMTLFIHGDDMPISVRVVKSKNIFGQNKKIEAIKWVRMATGYGLREAKDVIDDVDNNGMSSMFEVKNLDARSKLVSGLKDTGYELA